MDDVIIKCRMCGKDVVRRSNNQKYCADCAEISKHNSAIKYALAHPKKQTKKERAIVDTPAQIAKCLKCKKPECTDCIGQRHHMARYYKDKEAKGK